jgi:hypothetical protein
VFSGVWWVLLLVDLNLRVLLKVSYIYIYIYIYISVYSEAQVFLRENQVLKCG